MMPNLNGEMINIRILWYFFRPYKFVLLGLLFVMLVSGLLDAVNLSALYPLINYGLKLEGNNFILSTFAKINTYFLMENKFMLSCIELVIITFFALIFKYLYGFSANKLMLKISSDTQKEVFNKFISADYSFFVRNQQGKLIHAGTIATGQVSDTVIYALRLLYDVINSLFLFSLLFLLSRLGTFLLILIGLVYGILIKGVMGKIISRCATIATEEERKKNVVLNELINGIKTIKIFLNFGCWKQKYFFAVEQSLNNRFKMLMGRVYPDLFMRFIFFMLIACAGIVLSFKAPQSLISSVPLFGTFAMVMSRFFPAIQMIGADLMIIADSLPNVKIVHKLCTEKNNLIPDGLSSLESFNDELTFDDVWFLYDPQHEYLLKGVNFSIKKRQVTAIVGLSGAGKTTLINLLLRLYKPSKGLIKIDGVDIFKYRNSSYLSLVGYVSQETFIFNDTIKENIRFGKEDCTEEMIIEAAKQANAHEFIVSSRNGYDTIVGDLGIKLSGGQRQRIAIARALLRRPQIIVLDEATSSLDNIAEKNVQEAIDRLSQHITVVIIAHRISTVEGADKIVVLQDGAICEAGTHQELLRSNGLYFRLYHKQDTLLEETL